MGIAGVKKKQYFCSGFWRTGWGDEAMRRWGASLLDMGRFAIGYGTLRYWVWEIGY